MEFQGKTIFVAPLDWGLGHASRCVALINRLHKSNTVIIGTSPVTRPLLTAYFPDLAQVELPSYNIRYSSFLPQWLIVLLRAPLIITAIHKEKKIVRSLVDGEKVEVLISDNRYGVFHEGVPSYFICHQLKITAPFFSGFLSALHQSYLKRFTRVWVPDFSDHLLSGQLSAAPGVHADFIGPLSALSVSGESAHAPIKYLALLSGPEPQRSALEKRLLKILGQTRGEHVVVRGTNSRVNTEAPENVSVHGLVSGDLLRTLIAHADTVICRSGYSTLMDLHALGKTKIILIPTPGQPEQAYLALHWQNRFQAEVFRQRDLPERFPAE